MLFRVVNRVAIISLNRPQALNALSHEMVGELTRLFERCRSDSGIVAIVLRGIGDKAFCAGGDVRGLHGMVARGESTWLDFFVDEYKLDYMIHTFPKPVVVMLDGVTIGGRMGLGQGAQFPVVTERTKMATPEAWIGLPPDVGATRFLAAMPSELALYVGLTGTLLTGGDALHCNLADVWVPSQCLASLEERLAQMIVPETGDQVLSTIRGLFQVPGSDVPQHSPLRELAPLVARQFTEDATLEEVIASLQRDLASGTPNEVRQWIATTIHA